MEDEGRYYCIAENKFGQESVNGLLLVRSMHIHILYLYYLLIFAFSVFAMLCREAQYSTVIHIYAKYWLIFSPPGNDSFREDLSFTPDVFKIFFQREISEMRGPTGMKFCTVVITRPNFIMPVQFFFWGGAHPKKISGATNMQNLARFWTTLKFGGDYLQNG